MPRVDPALNVRISKVFEVEASEALASLAISYFQILDSRL